MKNDNYFTDSNGAGCTIDGSVGYCAGCDDYDCPGNPYYDDDDDTDNDDGAGCTIDG